MTDHATNRIDIYHHLLNYFEAYLALSMQALEAARRGEDERLVRMIDLRQETIGRINDLQREGEALLQTPADEVTESEVLKIRKRIRKCMISASGIDDDLAPLMTELRDKARSQAGDINQGRRKIQGYAQYSDRKARYVEEMK